jgi:nucleotide-binding universal stress UspA family protein
MKIMVCYDGSDEAKSLLPIAQQQAKAYKARVFAVMAMEGESGAQLEGLESSEKPLEYAKIFFENSGLEFETKLLVSEGALEAGETLVQYANEQQVDMIIIGVKKRSKVGKLLTGSNAQYVLLNAECPVLSAK